MGGANCYQRKRRTGNGGQKETTGRGTLTTFWGGRKAEPEKYKVYWGGKKKKSRGSEPPIDRGLGSEWSLASSLTAEGMVQGREKGACVPYGEKNGLLLR